jgi:hypothetical protein
MVAVNNEPEPSTQLIQSLGMSVMKWFGRLTVTLGEPARTMRAAYNNTIRD